MLILIIVNLQNFTWALLEIPHHRVLQYAGKKDLTWLQKQRNEQQQQLQDLGEKDHLKIVPFSHGFVTMAIHPQMMLQKLLKMICGMYCY